LRSFYIAEALYSFFSPKTNKYKSEMYMGQVDPWVGFGWVGVIF